MLPNAEQLLEEMMKNDSKIREEYRTNKKLDQDPRVTPFGKFLRRTPGITGIWQVSGRSDVAFERRCRLDEYYYNNWSIWLDMIILVKTIKVVLRHDGAV